MKYFLLGRVPPAFAKRRRANAGFLKTSRVVWAADEKANALNDGPKTGSEFVHAARKRPKKQIRPMIRSDHMARRCVGFKAPAGRQRAAVAKSKLQALLAGLPTMPEPRDEYGAIGRQNAIANDVAAPSKAHNDLPNTRIRRRVPDLRDIFDAFQRRPDCAHARTAASGFLVSRKLRTRSMSERASDENRIIAAYGAAVAEAHRLCPMTQPKP
jgi:hypothetical protein